MQRLRELPPLVLLMALAGAAMLLPAAHAEMLRDHRVARAFVYAAVMVWVLAAMGNNLAPGVIIGWWFGWSVFEVVVRLDAKPYVKEGPWWGQRYRKASVMDMTCYVGFKNLLIGAALFLALKSLGLIQL